MVETLKTSDMRIEEMLAADTLTVAVPMNNFSVPSTFKAYIDNLVCIGRRFFPAEGGGFIGALGEKKVIFITARGATYGEDRPIKESTCKHLGCKRFMGLTDMTSVHADGLDLNGPDYREQSLATAKSKLTQIVQTW